MSAAREFLRFTPIIGILFLLLLVVAAVGRAGAGTSPALMAPLGPERDAPERIFEETPHVGPPAWFLAAERTRIRVHLIEVEGELRARDVSDLSPRAQAARARQLDRLREYRIAGEFPLNADVPGERAPVFRDHRGVLCAMGYLLHEDGQTELVDRIATERNLARIPELADEPELLAWLEVNGLTVEEATRIQPAYDGWCVACIEDEPPANPRDPDGVSTGYGAFSAAAALTGGIASGWTMVSLGNGTPSRAGVVVGAGAGVTSIALGFAGLSSDSRDTRRVAGVNIGVGVLTAAAAVHAHRRSLQMSVGPWIPVEEDDHGRASRSAGLAGTIRF